MKTKLLLIAAGIGIIAAGACKKKSTDNNGNIDISGKTNQQVFMMQPWKIGSWTDSTATSGKVDALDPLLKDDKFTFNTTTTYFQERGANRASGEPATSTEPWSMVSANASEVTLMGGTYSIIGKSSTFISLSRTFMIGPETHKELLTFGKY
jgi:hypothetical protein